jgi:hypothetical protein
MGLWLLGRKPGVGSLGVERAAVMCLFRLARSARCDETHAMWEMKDSNGVVETTQTTQTGHAELLQTRQRSRGAEEYEAATRGDTVAPP